jgi:hypothetical protein
MKRSQRIQMVRFPNREKAEKRVMLFSTIFMTSVLLIDILLTSIGW